FDGAGGPYRYAHAAFGRLAGIEVGWLFYLVRITASATNANLFVILLGLLWPGATGPVASRMVLVLLIFPLALVNYRGVKGGTVISSALVVLKALPLVLFIGAGLWYLRGHGSVPTTAVVTGPGAYLDSILLLGFAYGGFEAALVPLAEARDPRRDAPFALFVALASCAVIYSLAQVVVTGTLADPASVQRPLAESARVIAGGSGAVFMTLAALISIAGYMAGTMVNVPRITWAMSDSGDLPGWLAAVHPRFRTPDRLAPAVRPPGLDRRGQRQLCHQAQPLGRIEGVHLCRGLRLTTSLPGPGPAGRPRDFAGAVCVTRRLGRGGARDWSAGVAGQPDRSQRTAAVSGHAGAGTDQLGVGQAASQYRSFVAPLPSGSPNRPGGLVCIRASDLQRRVRRWTGALSAAAS
ncbi:MAG: APC family permease, partial [Gemmatimonadota bacterium]